MVQARKNLGISQEELAECCSIGKSYICAIENGDRTPSGRLSFKISKVLGVKMEKFYEKEKEPVIN